MKGDFTRDTFKSEAHYQQVLMQQGRVQLDADWNEQSAIDARRDETTAADLIGGCGGPADNAAFAIITNAAQLAALPADPAAPIRQFGLSAGRYYVDGLQCEADAPFLFSWQPDHREAAALPDGNYLIYLDVWRRHVTVHENGDIREAALGGPDTATRVKTVWQVRAAKLDAPFDPEHPPLDPCQLSASEFKLRQRTALPQLAAKTADAAPDADPCTLPASAGYRGLENQLYRVEIHSAGNLGAATFKWSRENGAVVTRIENNVVVPVNGVNVNRLTVASTGLDQNLGFQKGSLVEIIHESEELEGVPGKLALIDDVDEGTGSVTLAKFDAEPMPIAIDLESNPRLRRWEASGTVAVDLGTNNGFIELESGIEIRFAQPAGAEFRTGDYWQIPARAASPDAQSGKIEWPGGVVPEFLPPRGIEHHYCRLAVVWLSGAKTNVSDCRCLWPALTSVPRLFYVSGDGQEVMPDLTAPAATRFKLPRPLIVGVANGHCLTGKVRVRFDVVNSAASPSSGQVVAAGGAPSQSFVIVPLDASGQAKVDFHLDGVHATQQVIARLLDANDHPTSLPIVFNANLSIASQVAYQPGGCEGLAGQTTVQDAIARLASLASVYKLSGDGQQAASGADLKEPLRVLVANRCGPVAEMPVTFKVILGGGSVTPKALATDSNGEIECDWRLGGDSILQVVEAEVAGDATRPTTDPRKVHFVAHLTIGEGGNDANDPAPVRVLDVVLRGPNRTLPNDERLALVDLRRGVAIRCDRIIDKDTVQDPFKRTDGSLTRGQPTCFVTAEIPYPNLPSEMRDLVELQLNVERLIGYRPLILHSEVHAEVLDDSPAEPGDNRPRSQIVWTPDKAALDFLGKVLEGLRQIGPSLDGILLRLTLKGNFIWSEEAGRLFEQGTPGGYLDGETFRSPKDPRFLVPSGDNRRGGDFEMWFWVQA